jgi:hypothetical protein
MPIREPQFFKDVVRFIVEALVKTLEVTEVMRIKIPAPAAVNQRRDLRALLAHESRVAGSR